MTPSASPLKAAREARSWSQRDLSRETAGIVSQSTISRAERALHRIHPRTRLALSAALGIPHSTLFPGTAA